MIGGNVEVGDMRTTPERAGGNGLKVVERRFELPSTEVKHGAGPPGNSPDGTVGGRAGVVEHQLGEADGLALIAAHRADDGEYRVHRGGSRELSHVLGEPQAVAGGRVCGLEAAQHQLTG